MFLTRLTQRDARSQNVVKLSPSYCIKQIDFILPWVCTLITHRGRQNTVRTKKYATSRRRVAYLFVHVLTSSVRYQSTDARQNEIYLLITVSQNVQFQKISILPPPKVFVLPPPPPPKKKK